MTDLKFSVFSCKLHIVFHNFSFLCHHKAYLRLIGHFFYRNVVVFHLFLIRHMVEKTQLNFPVANEEGIKSSVTQTFGGDCKLDQNHFLLNEQCIYYPGNNRMETRKIDPQTFLGWVQGRFIFDGAGWIFGRNGLRFP